MTTHSPPASVANAGVEGHGWPGEPGVPTHPERDGWHWIREGGHEGPERWVAQKQCWHAVFDPRGGLAPEKVAHWIYIGRALTPAEVAEEVAKEREAIRQAVSQMKQEAEVNMAKDGIPHSWSEAFERDADCYGDVLDVIRSRAAQQVADEGREGREP